MALELPDFNLSEEGQAFRDTLRRFFESSAPIGEARSAMEAGTGFSEALWKAASEELGLPGLAIAETDGGQGFGRKELALALAETGRCLAPIPLFASAALAAPVVEAVADPTARGAWLTPIAAGEIATLAWLETAQDWDPAACHTRASESGGIVRLSGEKHYVLAAREAARFFIVARRDVAGEGDRARDVGLGLFAVDAGARGLEVLPRETLDGTRPLATLRLDAVEARVVADEGAVADGLRRGLRDATALLCAEMVGGMQRVLETAVDYAGERYQFSRPIGSFQAIKHKCANMLIDFEASRTAADGAIVAIDEQRAHASEAPRAHGGQRRDLAGEADRLTHVAKSHVGPAYRRVTTENMQIQGGVGYTWEYDAHLYYRRATSSEGFLGGAVQHRAALTLAVAAGLERSDTRAAGRSVASGAGSDSRRREDTPEEAAFRAEVRAWLEANAELRGDLPAGPLDHSPEAEARAWERMKAWQRKKYDGGWAAITWPVEYGGRGGTAIEQMIFNEEQARFDVPVGFIAASLGMIGPALMRFGSERQKAYLPAMLRGDEVWCQLFSEPEAGSDLAAVRTRGEVDGDELVINGQKVWTTSAQFADKGFIVLRTNPDVPKHQGISFALIDMRQPGVEVRPLVTMRGDRHFNEVFLSDVRTPLDHVVNGLDRGWPVTTFVLMNEGAFIGTSTAGRTSALALVAEARRAGRLEDAQVRQQLGEACAREWVLEGLQARLRAALLDRRPPDVDGSVLKILAAEWGHARAETAVALQGAAGLLVGGDAPEAGVWQDQALSRGALSVGGGTLEVHRNGLGERALGLPREPRFDRDVPFRDLKTGA